MYRDVQDRLTRWWRNEPQSRPCILLTCPRSRQGAAAQESSPQAYWLDPACHESRAARGIEGKRYFGEALPYHYVDFGAVTLCAMQGCPAHLTSRETIWVDRRYDSVRDTLEAAIQDDLPFTQAVRQAFERVRRRLEGRALLAPYCIGSPADNLAGLIGTDSFLYALYDEPDLLEQALQIQLELWQREFAALCATLQPSADRPMTGWHGILAPGSTFPIQEDIGYMLGEEHYNRFCLPGIRAMVEDMEYPFFHLDGVGALKHLDALLGIDALKVIQWQPGEGHMQVDQWVHVVRRILSGGKSCQLYVQPEEVAWLADRVGARGLLLIVHTDEQRALRLAQQFGLQENMPVGEFIV